MQVTGRPGNLSPFFPAVTFSKDLFPAAFFISLYGFCCYLSSLIFWFSYLPMHLLAFYLLPSSFLTCQLYHCNRIGLYLLSFPLRFFFFIILYVPICPSYFCLHFIERYGLFFSFVCERLCTTYSAQFYFIPMFPGPQGFPNFELFLVAVRVKEFN